MKNVDIMIEDDIMIIRIDLSKSFGPSKTGKSITIASSEGNKKFDKVKYDKCFIGLNVYKTV